MMCIRGGMTEGFQKCGPELRPVLRVQQPLPPLQQRRGMQAALSEPPPNVVQSPVPSRRIGFQYSGDALPTHPRIGAEAVVVIRRAHRRKHSIDGVAGKDGKQGPYDQGFDAPAWCTRPPASCLRNRRSTGKRWNRLSNPWSRDSIFLQPSRQNRPCQVPSKIITALLRSL